MASLFEPSLSASTMRAPFSSTTTPSMAETLPSINFGFDELRERMAKFNHRFDDFIAEGRKRVLEERNQFRINLAELHGEDPMRCLQNPPPEQVPPRMVKNETDLLTRSPTHITEDKKTKKRDIDSLAQKSTTHAHTLTKEAAETEEMRASIETINTQHAARLSHRDALKVEMTTVQSVISQRLAAQRAYALKVAQQARLNSPELQFWEDYLCLRIDGAGMADHLRFVFTHVDDRNWERECWFELCTEKREYEVKIWEPKLERERVDEVVERLNESRDLGGFLKAMRSLFVEAMK